MGGRGGAAGAAIGLEEGSCTSCTRADRIGARGEGATIEHDVREWRSSRPSGMPYYWGKSLAGREPRVSPVGSRQAISYGRLRTRAGEGRSPFCRLHTLYLELEAGPHVDLKLSASCLLRAQLRGARRAA